MTATTAIAEPLTPRWTPLRHHVEQHRLVNSTKRFRVCAAGRRSGKTERMKREGVEEGLTRHGDANIIFAAPTRDQAKQIYWDDLKALIPRNLMAQAPKETELLIRFVHGPCIRVVGMDKPQRIEGIPIDWFCLDEMGDMKPAAWTHSLSPAVDTPGRPGRGAFIGKPKGRGIFYELYTAAQQPDMPDWDAFHWPSSDILTPEAIADAKRRMDDLSYQQEYEASFVDFTGRAYYPFNRQEHATERLHYNPALPLIFCFDFNVQPGVAVVLQEQEYKGQRKNVDKHITAVIGEVWIPRNSNTPAVCRKLLTDWSKHQGVVYCYGDYTGGARGTAKVAGSDWDIIKSMLRDKWKDKVRVDVKPNPRERDRVNCMNSRLKSADGIIHMLIDPVNCKQGILDLEGTLLLEGGSGEIQKIPGEDRTHWTDALGYYMADKHSLRQSVTIVRQLV